MAENNNLEIDSNSSTSMLIDLVKSVAVLTAEFKSFKDKRIEDNSELKEANAELKTSIKEVKTTVEKLQQDVDTLKSAPAKDKAAKWESFCKIVFEFALTACLVIVAVKIGLK